MVSNSNRTRGSVYGIPIATPYMAVCSIPDGNVASIGEDDVGDRPAAFGRTEQQRQILAASELSLPASGS